MGMYDTIRCHYPLPEGFEVFQDRNFQTKDLANALYSYEIDENGDLCHLVPIPSEEGFSHPDVQELGYVWCENFTGPISFYDFAVRGNPLTWIEFRALFEKGRLVSIETTKYEPSTGYRL